MNKLFSLDKTAKPLAPWPIRPAFDNDISPETAERIESLTKKQLTNFPRLNDPSIFGDNVQPGFCEGPTLFLEDHQGIDLMPVERRASHEYRILGLARPGDFCLISRPRNRSFEQYLGALFGSKTPTILNVNRGDDRLRRTLAGACLESESAMAMLVAAASSAGTLNICPYLSSGYDWLVGAEIARRSGCPVQICAPLPQLSRRVNDKLWFVDQVRTLLGQDSVPPTYSIYGPVSAAAILRKLAKRYQRLVIKLPASAGSMGNMVLESEFILSISLAELRNHFLERLHVMGWHDHYPLLVGVWETEALASPSAQMWVPEWGRGLPIVEGIFGQILSGDEQSFAGATQLVLPTDLENRFCHEAFAISAYFQRLGYVGRLSLDSLLTGKNLDNAELHWIECNGRWGGVSIPMIVARRLINPDSETPLFIVQRAFPDQNIPNFDVLLPKLESWLYTKEKGEGIVFLEPTDGVQQNVTFFVLAMSPKAAEQTATDLLNTIVEEVPALT
jgi:hypothetical protein